MEKQIPHISAFAVGDKLPEQFSRYFIGQAYLSPLTHDSTLNCPVSNVTFEPGCRNNWHSHTGGQMLIVVGGKGFYQAKGEPARLLLPGDVVEIPANMVHWHGAAPDSWFSHLAVGTNPQTNQNTWLEPVDDEQYRKATAEADITRSKADSATAANLSQWFPCTIPSLATTDPDFAVAFVNFAFGDVLKQGNLDVKTRFMVTLVSAIAQNTPTQYGMLLDGALQSGITPVELKELLYQSVPYAGIARVVDFIDLTNDFLRQKGVALPLEPQSTTTPETRFDKGLATQKSIFGTGIDQLYATSPKNQLHMQQYLSANCFGDYYTRQGLDLRTRELLTFSILVSLGGCDPQVKAHIQGNLAVGNGKESLIATVTQLLPYIGYPRTLNALRCLNEVIPEK